MITKVILTPVWIKLDRYQSAITHALVSIMAMEIMLFVVVIFYAVRFVVILLFG